MAALLVVDAGPLRLVEPVAAVVRRPLLLAAAADELAVVERVAPAVRSVLHVDHLDVAGQLRQRRVQRRRLRRQRRPAVDRRWAARASRRCHTHKMVVVSLRSLVFFSLYTVSSQILFHNFAFFVLELRYVFIFAKATED